MVSSAEIRAVGMHIDVYSSITHTYMQHHIDI